MTRPEERIEWGVRLTYDDGTEQTDECERSLAEARVRWHAERRASVPGWRVVAAEIVQRIITIGPWETAPLPRSGDRVGLGPASGRAVPPGSGT